MNLTLSVPKQLVDKLRDEAKTTGLSYSDIMRRAFDEYMEKRGKA